MRVSGEDGQLIARAIAGSHVVLLAMNLPRDAAEGLLGFALHRADRDRPDDGKWLPNFLRFEQNADKEGSTVSDDNPIQAFVWGDYTVDPGSRLTYRVETRYGTPGQLETRHVVELKVDVEPADDGVHGIFFNRGAAGSQAYSEKFNDVSPLDDPAAAVWLSRGLEEALLDFIKGARGQDVALRGAFYEFKHKSVLDELDKAAAEGVDVQLVVARPDPDQHGKEKYPGEDNVQPVEDSGLTDRVTWRRHCGGIPHNKFLVLLEGGTAKAVWTGSTNITDGALYGQSNVGHLVHDDAIAAAYLQYWNDLVGDPETDALRDTNANHNRLPDPGLPPPGRMVIFSPHHGTDELKWFADLMRRPDNQAIFFTAPFGIGTEFEEALKAQHPFPIYVLLDKGDNNMEMLRAVPGNELTAGAFLGHGRWRQFLEENLLDRLNPNVKFVHTKYMLVNPLSDDPVVISGSANFSPASVSANDENMLVIRGDTRVADIYLGEFMRLFTHMYFRARVTEDDPATAAESRVPTPESRGDTTPLFLTPDDGWLGEWFDEDGPKKRERELFASS